MIKSNIKINLPALFHRLSTLRTNYVFTTSAACTRFDGSRVDSDGGPVDSESSLVDSDG